MQSFDKVLCLGTILFVCCFAIEHLLHHIVGFAKDKSGIRLAKRDLLAVWQLEFPGCKIGRRFHADSRLNGMTSIAPVFPLMSAAVLIATASAALKSTASAECTYRDVIVLPLCPTSAPMVSSE